MLLLLSHFSRVRLCVTPSLGGHNSVSFFFTNNPVLGRTLEWVAISFSHA